MKPATKSIRPFIGAKNFEESRKFYADLDFEEVELFHNMSLFKVSNKLGFYLQDAFVKDWVDNTMLFLEVENVEEYYDFLKKLKLPEKYPSTRLSSIQVNNWGSVCFLHDPTGILWQFGQLF